MTHILRRGEDPGTLCGSNLVSVSRFGGILATVAQARYARPGVIDDPCPTCWALLAAEEAQGQARPGQK